MRHPVRTEQPSERLPSYFTTFPREMQAVFVRLFQKRLHSGGQRFLLCLGLGKVFAQRGKVGLDLRFGTRGAHHYTGAARQCVDEHVGRRQLDGLRLPVATSVLVRAL